MIIENKNDISIDNNEKDINHQNILDIIKQIKSIIEYSEVFHIMTNKNFESFIISINKEELEESKQKGNIVNNLNDYNNNKKYYENLKYDLICTIYEYSQINNLKLSFQINEDSHFYLINLIELTELILKKKENAINEEIFKLSIFYLVQFIKDAKDPKNSMTYKYCFYKQMFLELLKKFPNYEDEIFKVSKLVYILF